jgi:sensor histidine kinase YesM
MARWRTFRAALPAWLLLGLMFAALYDGFPSARALLKGGALAAVTAASALLVWWGSGRIPWPGRVTWRTYAVHAGLAAFYGLIWTALDLAQASLIAWENRFRFFSFELVIYGIIVYGVAVGLSYAVRAQARARAQELATARLETVASRARLDALRARLNPHFLFNCLHALSPLIRHRPAAAEEAIERLGFILRYVLDEDQESVPLGMEWRFVEDYLAIERLRLGQRLRLALTLDPAAGACQLPPLSIQPLVENAIRHAVAPRVEGGFIGIRAQREGSLVRIVVTDDGPGAMPETVFGGGGLGLRAVGERLEAWSVDGLRGSLSVATAPGRGFAATLLLPAGVEPALA